MTQINVGWLFKNKSMTVGVSYSQNNKKWVYWCLILHANNTILNLTSHNQNAHDVRSIYSFYTWGAHFDHIMLDLVLCLGYRVRNQWI